MRKIVYLFIALSLLVAGCSDGREKSIVGVWQEINNPKGRLDFRKDHTGVAYWPDENGKQESSAMKWKLTDGTVSVITPPGPVDFSLKANQLIAPNGLVLTKIQ